MVRSWRQEGSHRTVPSSSSSLSIVLPLFFLALAVGVTTPSNTACGSTLSFVFAANLP